MFYDVEEWAESWLRRAFLVPATLALELYGKVKTAKSNAV